MKCYIIDYKDNRVALLRDFITQLRYFDNIDVRSHIYTNDDDPTNTIIDVCNNSIVFLHSGDRIAAKNSGESGNPYAPLIVNKYRENNEIIFYGYSGTHIRPSWFPLNNPFLCQFNPENTLHQNIIVDYLSELRRIN